MATLAKIAKSQCVIDFINAEDRTTTTEAFDSVTTTITVPSLAYDGYNQNCWGLKLTNTMVLETNEVVIYDVSANFNSATGSLDVYATDWRTDDTAFLLSIEDVFGEVYRTKMILRHYTGGTYDTDTEMQHICVHLCSNERRDEQSQIWIRQTPGQAPFVPQTFKLGPSSLIMRPEVCDSVRDCDAVSLIDVEYNDGNRAKQQCFSFDRASNSVQDIEWNTCRP